jgi:hypothetical protein
VSGYHQEIYSAETKFIKRNATHFQPKTDNAWILIINANFLKNQALVLKDLKLMLLST